MYFFSDICIPFVAEYLLSSPSWCAVIYIETIFSRLRVHCFQTHKELSVKYKTLTDFVISKHNV